MTIVENEQKPVPAKKKVGGGKVSLSTLGGIDHATFSFDGVLSDSPTHYECEMDGHTYDMLWNPVPNAERLYVFFSGDANREKYTPPVFQRWKWAKRFPGACLFISDPTLAAHEKLGLAWYCGTPQFDPLESIGRLIKSFAAKLGLSGKQVVLYGSSGGGFAVLRMLSQDPDFSAISINPQVVIPRYQKQADRYFSYAFPEMTRDEVIETYSSRFDLRESGVDFLNRRVIFCQNVSDTHHYDEHFKALTDQMGIERQQENTGHPFRIMLFDNPNGHAKAEAENPEVIVALIKNSLDWK